MSVNSLRTHCFFSILNILSRCSAILAPLSFASPQATLQEKEAPVGEGTYGAVYRAFCNLSTPWLTLEQSYPEYSSRISRLTCAWTIDPIVVFVLKYPSISQYVKYFDGVFKGQRLPGERRSPSSESRWSMKMRVSGSKGWWGARPHDSIDLHRSLQSIDLYSLWWDHSKFLVPNLICGK